MNQETQSAWKMWTQHPCFQELLEMAETIKKESIADEDRVPTAELDIAVIAENRGVRIGLKTLLRRINDKVG